jgi:hypothetical protein
LNSDLFAIVSSYLDKIRIPLKGATLVDDQEEQAPFRKARILPVNFG